jgi:glutamate-1-semialdehyde 2,1-aminomutase
MAASAMLDRAHLDALAARENERFVAERPISTALLARSRRTMPRGVPMTWMDDLYEHPPVFVADGHGATITDVDGHAYLDMYIGDMSAFCGHAPHAVVEAVSRRMALGNQFLMPGEDAIVVAEHLVARYGMPKWQFTLSATQANTEVIRLARAATGREIVLLFDGKYHGHGDATLVVLEDGKVQPEEHGLPRSITGQARIIGFNDVDALEAALAQRDVAVVLAEPAMTNAGFILPDAGFHDVLRRLTRETGTLLAIDETHSLVTAYGGLTRAYGLEPDMLTIGKSIAAGVPLGAYGMTEEIASHIVPPPSGHHLVSGKAIDQVSTGGTLFANALSMAAGRAALLEVLTEEAFERTARLGERMASGLRAAIQDVGLPWTVVQLGAHATYFFTETAPRNGAESRAADDPQLRALMRVWLANRGVWESGWWLGPTVSLAHTAADVDHYVDLLGQCLADLTRSDLMSA